MIDKNSFKSNELMDNYEKLPISTILEHSEKIDVALASKEVLTWIANNVEQFIDNQRRMFKLDLIIDAEETMAEIKKLQDLYRAIPNDPSSNVDVDLANDNYNDILASLPQEDQDLIEQIQGCRSKLDEVTEGVFKAMKSETDLLESLFKRMGFYYELQGINEGRLLLDELDGEVDVLKFEYESFPVAVQVNSPNLEILNGDGTITKEGGEKVCEYVIPEGFTVWLEIAFKSRNREMTNLF